MAIEFLTLACWVGAGVDSTSVAIYRLETPVTKIQWVRDNYLSEWQTVQSTNPGTVEETL